MRITNESVRDACVVPDAAERFLSVFLRMRRLIVAPAEINGQKKKRGEERERERNGDALIRK